jgi:hypothetical protein
LLTQAGHQERTSIKRRNLTWSNLVIDMSRNLVPAVSMEAVMADGAAWG